MTAFVFVLNAVCLVFLVWATISITGSLSSISNTLKELASIKRLATDERELASIAESLREIGKHVKSGKE